MGILKGLAKVGVFGLAGMAATSKKKKAAPVADAPAASSYENAWDAMDKAEAKAKAPAEPTMLDADVEAQRLKKMRLKRQGK